MTSKAEIAGWFDCGIAEGASHMLVVCDTFAWEDYPVFATSSQEALDKFAEYDGRNMQRIMEVYDLRSNKAEQLDERRAWHLPLATKGKTT